MITLTMTMQMINALDDENKVDAGESNDQNLNLEIFEKWMVKIFPPNLKLNFWITQIMITFQMKPLMHVSSSY